MGQLHQAAKKGDLAEVKRLLDGGFLRSAIPVDEQERLTVVEPSKIISSRDTSYISSILQAPSLTPTALEWAAFYNHMQIVVHLVELRGANTDRVLEAAARGSAGNVVNYLIVERKMDVNKAEKSITPIEAASIHGHLDMVKYLVETHKAIATPAALNRAASSGNLAIAKYLFEKCNVFASTNALKNAVSSGLPMVKYLVETCKVPITEEIMTAAGLYNVQAMKYFVEERNAPCFPNTLRDLKQHSIVAQSSSNYIFPQARGGYEYLNGIAEKRFQEEKAKARLAQAQTSSSSSTPLPIIEKKSVVDTSASQELEKLKFEKQALEQKLEFEKLKSEKQVLEQKLEMERMKSEEIKANQTKAQSYTQPAYMPSKSTGNKNQASSSAPSMHDVISSMGLIAVSLEIPYAELTLGKKLGEGGFGVVYQAKWKFSDVAVKQLRIGNFSEVSIKDFKHEASVMAKLRNPHIIQLYGICINQPYCLVMEYATKGSLYAVLHSNEEMDWPRRLKIAAGTAKGLAFLHNQNPMILHRDIKSMNVLLDESFTPKLTDFGLAKIKDAAASTSSTSGGVAGTLHWMAPELLDGDNTHYTTACDIYSLAILLWEISSRKLPYEGKRPQQILATVLQGKREPISVNCPPPFGALITNCWKQIAGERPPIESVIQTLEQGMTANNTSTAQSGYLSLN